MSKNKEVKTNAMRMLEKHKISYTTLTYECDEFVDALKIADQLGLPCDLMYKTLVTEGTSGSYFVFVIPIHRELDLKKAARSVGEKSVSMIHVKDINRVTGYIRGGCTGGGHEKRVHNPHRPVRQGAGNHDCQRRKDRGADPAEAGGSEDGLPGRVRGSAAA